MTKPLLICLLILVLILIYFFYIQYKQTNIYHGPLTNHFDGKEFHNGPGYTKHNFMDILRWSFTADKKVWPKRVGNTAQPNLTPVENDQIKITFINHATMLVQTKDVTFLTDPVWSYRVSPFSWYGPHRVREPGVAFDKLPKIDLVLVSHSHYDHLDIPTLQKLCKAFHPIFIVPLGDKYLLEKNGIDNVVELDWWQTYKTPKAIITFLPAQHWAQRWLNDKFKTLWGGYGIEINHKKIFFGGDCGYSSNFIDIQKQWGSPDIAFLPIGAYLPRWFMKANHLNPEDAVKAHQDLKAKTSIGIHFGTFQLSDEGIDDPVIDLHKALKNAPEVDFITLQVGETKTYN